MDAAERFGQLLLKEKLPHQISPHGEFLLYTVEGPNGHDASIEFRVDGIYASIESMDFVHYWQIYPTDLKQAIKKIRDIA